MKFSFDGYYINIGIKHFQVILLLAGWCVRKKLWKDRCRFACFVGLRGTESAGFVGFCFKRAGREIMFLAEERNYVL